MRVLSEAEFASEAAPMLHRMFSGNDPYTASYTDFVETKLILFEYWYEIESPLLEVLVDLSVAQGETGMYLSYLDRPRESRSNQPYHWYIDFTAIEQYKGLVGPIQNVVYSQKGTWAIMGSDEHHGLLACSRIISQNLLSKIPTIPSQVEQFVLAWKQNKEQYGANISWLEPLLLAIYGQAYTDRLLRDF